MAENSIYQAAATQYSPTEGPFTDVLSQGLHPAMQQQSQEPYGGGNKYGVIAMLGDKALQGIQRGRLMRYVAGEAMRAKQYNAGLSEFDQKIMEVQNDPTLGAEDKQIRIHKLQQDRLTYTTGHFNQAMEGMDGGQQGKKGKGKSAQGGQGAAPGAPGGAQPQGKKGAGGAVQQTEHIGAKIGGILQGVMNRVAGPNLPTSRPVDLDWVKARVSDIDDMPSTAKKNAEQSWNGMINDLTQKLGRKPYQEDITSDPRFGQVTEQYLKAYPSGVAESIFNARMGGYPTEEKQYQLDLTEQTVKGYRNLFNAAKESQTVHGRQGGPNAQSPTLYDPKTGTVRPLGGGERSGPPGAPLQAQEAPKSPTAQVTSAFNSPGIEPYFGAEIPIDPSIPGIKNTNVFAYKTRPDGTQEVIALNSPVPGLLVEAGTNRLFYAADARQDGWKLSAATPRDERQEPQPRTGRIAVNGTLYQTQWDKDKKDWVFSTVTKDGKSQNIPLGNVPGLATNTRNAMTQFQNIAKDGDTRKKRIQTQIDAIQKDIDQANEGGGSHANASVEDRNKYVAQRQQELLQKQKELDGVDDFTKLRLEILKNGLHADYMQMGIDEMFGPGGSDSGGGAEQPDYSGDFAQ